MRIYKANIYADDRENNGLQIINKDRKNFLEDKSNNECILIYHNFYSGQRHFVER